MILFGILFLTTLDVSKSYVLQWLISRMQRHLAMHSCARRLHMYEWLSVSLLVIVSDGMFIVKLKLEREHLVEYSTLNFVHYEA